VGYELLGEELNPTYLPNRMAGNNDKYQARPHLGTRLPVNPEIPMSVFRERLEALHPRNRNDSHSQVEETNPPTGEDLTNL